jgi:hypothetical protein
LSRIPLKWWALFDLSSAITDWDTITSRLLGHFSTTCDSHPKPVVVFGTVAVTLSCQGIRIFADPAWSSKTRIHSPMQRTGFGTRCALRLWWFHSSQKGEIWTGSHSSRNRFWSMTFQRLLTVLSGQDWSFCHIPVMLSRISRTWRKSSKKSYQRERAASQFHDNNMLLWRASPSLPLFSHYSGFHQNVDRRFAVLIGALLQISFRKNPDRVSKD